MAGKKPAKVAEFFKKRNEYPPEVLEYFKKEGAKGGKRSLQTMTPEERQARAKKAVAAREAKRTAKKKS